MEPIQEPTNLQLQETMRKQEETIREHTVADLEQFAQIHTRFDGLATKEDIAELKDFLRKVNAGVGVLRFSWNNASKIGSFIIFFGAVILFIKYGVLGLIAWFVTSRY